MSNDTKIMPSSNGDNGLVLSSAEGQADARDGKGRFLPGNKGGPGNPQARNVATWRKALADSVSGDDVSQVMQKLMDAAKAGEPWAIHELLDRTLGKATQPHDLRRGEDNTGPVEIVIHHVQIPLPSGSSGTRCATTPRAPGFRCRQMLPPGETEDAQ